MAAIFSSPSQATYLKAVGIGMNLNSTGDVWSISNLPTVYYEVEKFVLWNFSAVPASLLVLSLRDGASGSGNNIVGTLSLLNTTVTGVALGLDSFKTAGANNILNQANLYMNVSVANGSALTCNATLYYRLLQ